MSRVVLFSQFIDDFVGVTPFLLLGFALVQVLNHLGLHLVNYDLLLLQPLLGQFDLFLEEVGLLNI